LTTYHQKEAASASGRLDSFCKQKEERLPWGYYQGKPYLVLGGEPYESRLHKYVRRAIAAVLVSGTIVFASYKALGSPDLGTLLAAPAQGTIEGKTASAGK
jgi:hypothetical protein